MHRRTAVTVLAAAAALGAPAAAVAAAPVQLGTGGTKPWVLVDRQGVTHVVWESGGGLQSTLHYRRRPPGAAAFESDRVLPVAAGTDFAGAEIVQDPAPGTRLVIVAERCCTAPSTYALTSPDNGVTWSASVPVFEGGPAVNEANGRIPLIAAGPGVIWLVNGNPSFRYAQIPAALTPVVPLVGGLTPLAGAAPYDTQVVVDETGQPVFGWGDGSFHRNLIRRGAAGPDQEVASVPGTLTSLHLAGGPSGVGTLSITGAPGAVGLSFRRMAGGVLGGPVTITTPPTDDPRVPFLASDAAGRFHAAWATGGATAAVVYRRSPDGVTWTRPSRLVAPGATVFGLVVAAGPDGRGWAVWTDDTSNGRVLATPLDTTAVIDDDGTVSGGGSSGPGVPDTSGIVTPRVTRNGPGILVAPSRVSLRSIRRTKCVKVRVQTTRPASIGVAIFSGRLSRRVFGRATVVFRRPGKRVVCVRVPLRARTFNVRQPFRFAFAVREGVPGAPGRRPARERVSPVFRFLP